MVRTMRVDQGPQGVGHAGGQVETDFGGLGDTKLVEPVVDDAAVRVQELALDRRQAVIFARVLEAGQETGGAGQAARHFGLDLHQYGLGAELADVLQLVGVHGVGMHQARHVEVAQLALFRGALGALFAPVGDRDQGEHALALLDRERDGADRVGIEDLQLAQSHRLVGGALDRVGQGDAGERVAVKYVKNRHGAFPFQEMKKAPHRVPLKGLQLVGRARNARGLVTWERCPGP